MARGPENFETREANQGLSMVPETPPGLHVSRSYRRAESTAISEFEHSSGAKNAQGGVEKDVTANCMLEFPPPH